MIRAILLLTLLSPAVALATDDDRLAELLSEIEAVRNEAGIAAVGLALVKGDNVLHAGAQGVKDRDTGEPVDANTLFRIGSITKTFTALAALKLAETGAFDLDDPVRRHVEDIGLLFRNPWAGSRPVRIAHLLEHTAAIPELSSAEFDVEKPLALEAALRFRPQRRRLRWPPGLHKSYTNAGAGVLWYTIRAITGHDYDASLQRELFAPLRMRHASVKPNPATRQRLAQGYDRDGRTPIPYWHMLYRPFGAINATPRGMSNFLRMLLNRGRFEAKQIVSPSVIERMETPHTTLAARAGLTYGYGAGLYSFLHAGYLFHGHGGDADGYLSHFGYNRRANMAYFVVITAFDHGPIERIEALLRDFIVADLAPPEPPPRQPVPAERLLDLTGQYIESMQRFGGRPETLRVEYRSGELRRHMGGRAHRLIPVDKRRFRLPGQPLATIAFVEYQGKLYLQGEFGNYRRVATADSAAPIPK